MQTISRKSHASHGPDRAVRCARRPFSGRRGLAPLELVLSLFFLLLMMALIINFGTIATWWVRGNVAARWAAWRSVGLRTGGGYPNPPNWQISGATLGLAPGQPINPTRVNQIWNQGDLSQAAVRGQPLAAAIVDPATGNQFGMGNQQYMEMTNLSQIGTANLTKSLPLLPNLRKSTIQPQHPVLNLFWRFEDMASKSVDTRGYPWAMRNNGDWRLFKWYQLEAQQLPVGDVQEQYMLYQAADQQLQQNPGQQALMPLDRDDEFMAWGQIPPPDFYPRIGGCEMSPQLVQLNILPALISSIEGPKGGGRGGVPDRMAAAFIQLYQKQLTQAQMQQPPDIQAISNLQQKIQNLQKFQATLF